MGKKWIGIMVTNIILIMGPFIVFMFWKDEDLSECLIGWPLYFLVAACAEALLFVSNYYADFLEKQIPKSMLYVTRWGSFVLAEIVIIIFSGLQY